jgi:hypothetical protein
MKYSAELIADIENWFKTCPEVISAAKKGDKFLFQHIGSYLNALMNDEDMDSPNIKHIYSRERNFHENRIYGKVLDELNAWEKQNPQPKSQSQPTPNKYFDDEVSK